MEKQFKADFNQLSNDLFWSFYTPIEFDHSGNEVKTIGMEKLKWTGYNDSDWWHKWSKQDGYNRRTDKLGNVWEIDFETNVVTKLGKN